MCLVYKALLGVMLLFYKLCAVLLCSQCCRRLALLLTSQWTRHHLQQQPLSGPRLRVTLAQPVWLQWLP